MTFRSYLRGTARWLLVASAVLTLATVSHAPSGEAKTDREYLNITCSDALEKLNSGGKSDGAGESGVLQSYKSKWVKWSGTVTGVNETLWGMELGLKCGKGPGKADVIISFESSWKPKVLQLAVGEQVQFTGQVDSFEESGGISIREGELIPREEPRRRVDLPPPPPSPPQEHTQAGGSDQAVQKPFLAAGDVFVIEHKNLTNPKLSYTGERKVISSDVNRVRITAKNLNSSYERTLDYDQQWNLIATRGSAGEGSDYTPAVKYYDFPLYPGKQWSGRSTERNIKTGQLREHTLVAEVGGWETVTVSAGTFRAIKVSIRSEVRDLQTGEIKSGTDVSWYAPTAKRSVKSELRAFNARDGQDDVQVAELIRYSVR